jgi:hypothetical protein
MDVKRMDGSGSGSSVNGSGNASSVNGSCSEISVDGKRSPTPLLTYADVCSRMLTHTDVC